MFDEEFGYFVRNQNVLVAEHRSKILTLRGSSVVAVHDTMLDAYLDGMKTFPPGTFMLQRCEPGPDAYTVTISTPGLFAHAL